uniref:transmembrane protease serine 9-like n=1 Tax=Euleptes europaea TaxID=460621 RepID=UPI0025409924|nr:transmembrane protease serine 9-like [Euleptes europaea]
MKLLLGLWSLSHLLLSSSGDEEPAGTSKGNVFQVTDAFANNGFFSLRFYGCIAVFNKSLNFQEAILVCGNQQPWANDDNELREQTRDREAPWLVNIVGNGQQCQGAVLNNWWILTAASCFLRMKPSSVELIMAGGYPFTITVSQYLSHRGFSSWARPPSNDLGLVMLGQPIDLRKREMWPICLPDRQESSLTRAQCRIYKREQDDSKQWLERIAVYFLEMSECTAEWPGTSERWNLCMAREVDNETDCKVPVGSPVLCHNLNSDHWELRGIVSQGLTNCTHPVLATQVVPHLEWLWQEGLLKDPVPPTMGYTETTGSSMPSLAEEGSSETAPQLQDVFPTQEESEASPTEQPPAVPTTPRLVSRAHMTMEQCEMGLAWNSVSRTYQLNKVADLMERKIGCGLRPGFVPHCPSCSEAEVGEFPWVVSLTLSIQHFCAGSILNPWWILTTANCANLIKNSAALVLVQAGLVDISEGTGSVHIRQALTYPDVLASEDLHNLGLLQLQKPLEFGPLIAPVCLSDTAHAIEDFRNCWLPSWTVLQGGPARLLRRPLASLNISSCNRLEENLSKAIFCITAQKDQEGICKGDLGSPLICPDPKGGAWVQLGVLSSFDEACSRPYVFNSLHPYLPWLEETTKAAGYRDNYTVSWQRQGPALQLRTLQKPEALVKRISAHLSLPWQAFVATCRKRSCGGSILNHYWVLTTARCVQDTKPENIAVFVGLKHPKGHARGILVAGIYPYEGIPWSNVSAGNVALLLLQESVAFGKYATRMTLPLTDTWDSCKVTGLQTLKPGEAEPDPAAYQAKVVQASDCARKHPRVNPSMYCVIRNDNHSLPVATMPEGAGLLCRLEAKRNPWSQVGLTSEPFPGSQPDILASSIVAYKDWIKETSKEARRHFLQSRGRTAHGPSWSLLLIPSLFGVTALG